MTDREVMQQALKALLSVKNHGWDEDTHTGRALIAALRTALEQQAEPCQFCGLTQCDPRCMWVEKDIGVEQAESVDCWDIGKDNPDSLAKHSAFQATQEQQAEPVAWDKPSASFNEWWNGEYDDSENPFEQDSAGYWAWAGWQAAQRPWVGLSDEDFLEACQIAERGNYLLALQRIQIKLKERNA